LYTISIHSKTRVFAVFAINTISQFSEEILESRGLFQAYNIENINRKTMRDFIPYLMRNIIFCENVFSFISS